MKNIVCIVLIVFSLISIFCLPLETFAQPQNEITIYVSPDGSDDNSGTEPGQAFATIVRARDAIRALKKDGTFDRPVTVNLREGIHHITEPVILMQEDSGTEEFPITYTAYPGEKAVISGGRTITGWKHYKDNIWMTEIPDVKSGKWVFRQLYINGEQRTRARIPNEGFKRVDGFPDGGHEVPYHTDSQRFEYAEGDLDPSWTNLGDVEVIVYHFWTDSHLPIQSIDAENRIVTFKHKAGKVFTDDFTSEGARYIVENVFEGMDQPGEWYLNRKTGVLYYIPMPGEDMDEVEATAPDSSGFLTMQGNAKERQFVEYVQFKNLNFEYTHFELPVGNSNDRQGSASIPAAIQMTGVRHCTFENNTIRNLGTFAFELSRGCTSNTITRNLIHHIAAGGFRVNGGSYNDHPLERTGYNEISDNHLHHFGEDYPSAVGVLLMNTFSNHVAHNSIHNGWYTGVSVGWSWGYQPSISRDNVVEFNEIHTIGQGLLSDMGAIYTLGLSPGTVLRNNLIHDVSANRYGGWGIYNDEGTSHMLVENNIVYHTKFAGYNIHYCKEVTVRNNIFALGTLQQLSRSRMEPHRSVFFENNIVYWKEGKLLDGNWKDEPYDFYYNPNKDNGIRKTNSTFEMDWNLFFNPDLSLNEVDFNGQTWEEWNKRGKDRHSVYADPMFVDVEHYDFRLKPESPAFALGFKPIDMSDVGPRYETGAAGE